jgi:hypothetical protein
MECPVCGGEMWSNAGRKKTPKSPDFKCKDKECGKAVWLKPKAPQNGGGRSDTGASYTWEELALTFKRCHEIAVKVVGASPAEVTQAATATLFIGAQKVGLKVSRSKPTPPPKEDFEEPPFDDVPEDDLPF